jgi:hypothetical protein
LTLTRNEGVYERSTKRKSRPRRASYAG